MFITFFSDHETVIEIREISCHRKINPYDSVFVDGILYSLDNLIQTQIGHAKRIIMIERIYPRTNQLVDRKFISYIFLYECLAPLEYRTLTIAFVMILGTF